MSRDHLHGIGQRAEHEGWRPRRTPTRRARLLVSRHPAVIDGAFLARPHGAVVVSDDVKITIHIEATIPPEKQS